MSDQHETNKYIKAPLETALIKLYPTALLRWLNVIYPEGFKAAARATPAGGAGQSLASSDKIPAKVALAGLLQTILRDPVLGRGLFDALPSATRDVLKVVTWDKRVNLYELEAKTKHQIAKQNPDKNRCYWEPFLLPLEHSFLCVVKNNANYWSSFGAREDPPKKQDYSVTLPDAIRRAFRKFVSPPPEFHLEPVEAVPNNLLRYTCEPQALNDLRLVAEYIAQGHLKYGKSERIMLSSLKSMRQIADGPEFFGEDKTPDKDLLLLRTRLLVGGMAFASAEVRDKLLAQPGHAEPVRALFDAVTSQAHFLREELLAHMPTDCGAAYSRPAIKEIVDFFAKFPSDKWIFRENMLAYHTLREKVPSPFVNDDGKEVRIVNERESWHSRVWTSDDNVFQLIGAPMLDGFAFLLAAYGLAEIAYTQPPGTNWHRAGKAYLTPFGGLRFARLTALGEYVFGKRATYEVAATSAIRAAIVLDERRLLATCRNMDALTELALSQFMEKLAPNRYRMTPQSLLRGCVARQALEERLVLFRRVVSAKPPAVWEQFFKNTLARIAPLEREAEHAVFKIHADESIRHLFATDPVMRELSLKVEGLRVAVRQSDLKKLAKRLEHFGYLSPLPQLTHGQ